MEESVTGRCRVCRGQPSADFGVLDARWVPGAFRARLSERNGTKEKRAGTYLRSAFPREFRGGRSARTRMSGRKRSWFTAGLFFVHRHVRHGPLLRQRWGGREQSVQVAFWQRFVAIGGEERTHAEIVLVLVRLRIFHGSRPRGHGHLEHPLGLFLFPRVRPHLRVTPRRTAPRLVIQRRAVRHQRTAHA